MMRKIRQIHQRHSKVLTVSVNMTLVLLLLVFLANIQIAHSQETTTKLSENSSPCELSPIEVPTLPENIPGYTELDPDTNLHVTGTATVIELESYRLEIIGKVKQPLSLTYDDLRCMPKTEARPTLVCPGFFQDTATWAGVPLKDVLALVELQEGANKLRLVSADGYATSIPLEEALSEENFLAYEWEGKPIPILHGFPMRAIFPQQQGNKWVKWLVEIEIR